jgi:hypothetical protein
MAVDGSDDVQRPAPLSQLIHGVPAKIAAGYWSLVLFAFFGMQAGGFDMIASGAIPVAVLTAPWSLVAIAVVTSCLASDSARTTCQPLISAPGTFLVLPVLCGGLNAILVFVTMSAIQRKRTGRLM